MTTLHACTIWILLRIDTEKVATISPISYPFLSIVTAGQTTGSIMGKPRVSFYCSREFQLTGYLRLLDDYLDPPCSIRRK